MFGSAGTVLPPLNPVSACCSSCACTTSVPFIGRRRLRPAGSPSLPALHRDAAMPISFTVILLISPLWSMIAVLADNLILMLFFTRRAAVHHLPDSSSLAASPFVRHQGLCPGRCVRCLIDSRHRHDRFSWQAVTIDTSTSPLIELARRGIPAAGRQPQAGSMPFTAGYRTLRGCSLPSSALIPAALGF